LVGWWLRRGLRWRPGWLRLAGSSACGRNLIVGIACGWSLLASRISTPAAGISPSASWDHRSSYGDSRAATLLQAQIINEVPFVIVVFIIKFLDCLFLAHAGYADDLSAAKSLAIAGV